MSVVARSQGPDREGERHRHTPCNNGTIIARKSAVRRCCGGRTPQVLGRVGEERSAGLLEEGSPVSILLGEDDLVEQ